MINSKIEINEKKLKKVIEATSFEKIQKLEKKSGFSEAKIKKNGEKINFFNLGPENKWENLLDKDIVIEIEKEFEAEMRELGYL